MPASKLEAFVRGVGFRDRDLPVDDVVRILREAIEWKISWDSEEEANRALLKLASLAVAFWREAGEIVAGNFELDLRDEAVLDAVVAHLERNGGKR